eukprot:327348-Rhodomonas_salina.1
MKKRASRGSTSPGDFQSGRTIVLAHPSPVHTCPSPRSHASPLRPPCLEKLPLNSDLEARFGENGMNMLAEKVRTGPSIRRSRYADCVATETGGTWNMVKMLEEKRPKRSWL